MREAIVHIPHSEFAKVGLDEVVSLFREAGLRDITELVCEGDGGIVVLTVDEPVDEEKLESMDEYLEWWERLSGESDNVDYLCKFSLNDIDEGVQLGGNPGVTSDGIRVDDDGVNMAMVGSQDDIAREIRDFGEVGISVLLQRISDYGGPRNTLDSLTERQRQIIQTAYELGYYEVPRSVSTADIAEELQLDASTVGEHLQRAERNMVTNLLASP